MTNRTLTAALLSLGLAASAAVPALADGAASTRNILLGGAAAAAGTLIIINHNKQVHQRYADDARRQADTQAQANNARAAYAAERRAYENEVAVNSEYRHEVATQHTLIVSLRKQVASERSRSHVAQSAVHAPAAVAPAALAAVPPTAPRAAAAVPAPAAERPVHVASTSWGWGQL